MRVALLGLSILVLSGCGVVTKTTAESANTAEKPLAVQASDPTTPQEVYAWINSNIRYQVNDEHMSAEKTLALGYGDCNDMAILADYMLEKKGYTAEVLDIYTANTGHSVCVWKDSTGKYNHLSNKTIRETHSTTLAEIAQDVYADWTVCVTYPDNIAIQRQ